MQRPVARNRLRSEGGSPKAESAILSPGHERPVTAREGPRRGVARHPSHQLELTNRAQKKRSDMRKIALSLLLASMVAALACSSDRALAPSMGHKSQLDFPPNML